MDNLPIGFQLIRNAITECGEIIKWMESQPEQWGRSLVVDAQGNDIESAARTSDQFKWPMHSFRNPTCVHNANAAVFHHLDAYGQRFNFPWFDIDPVSVQRYEIGQHHEVHVDHGPATPRIVSALVYLNTVHEGGETYFPNFDLAFKPEEGTLLIFPSNFIYAHSALAPRSNRKYSVAYWARG